MRMRGLRPTCCRTRWRCARRTIRGTIDSSLFEAVEAAGGHDQTAVGARRHLRLGHRFRARRAPRRLLRRDLPRDLARRRVREGRPDRRRREFVNQGHEFRAVRYADPDGRRRTTTPPTAAACTRHSCARRWSSPASARASTPRACTRSLTASAPTRASTTPRPSAPRCAPPAMAASASRASRAATATWWRSSTPRSIITVYGHLSRFAQRHARRRARDPGHGHRLRRHDRARHRPAPALRIPGQRRVQEPADRGAARALPDRGALARGFPRQVRPAAGLTLEPAARAPMLGRAARRSP